MQKGITLIEILLCVSIVSIISGMATLIIGQSLAKQELESASSQLAADIRWMQQISINAGVDKVYTLRFNNATPYGYYIITGFDSVKRILFPASVRLSGEHSYIYFHTNGTPAVGAQSISLYSTKLKIWKYVIVAPVTGRVRVSDVKGAEIEE